MVRGGYKRGQQNSISFCSFAGNRQFLFFRQEDWSEGVEEGAGLSYRLRMPQSFRTVQNWADYTFGCPEGKWTAQLDNKAWGKGKVGNIILYLSEIGTDNKYWLSVFWDNGYRADDEGLCFRQVEPGAVLELTTAKTKTGKPRLLSAVKLSG